MHDRGTVAVEAPDAAVGFLKGDAEGNLRGVTHGAYGEEVAFVALPHGGAVFEEFAAYHARCRDHCVTSVHGGSDGLYGLFARQSEVVFLDVLQLVGVECVLLDDQCEDLMFVVYGVDGLEDLLLGFFFLFVEYLVVDAHDVEQACGYLALLHVLRLVVYAGAAAPADEKQYGDVVYLLVGQRCQRVDDVALAAVLHVDDPHLAGGEVVTGGKTDSGSFVGSDDVMTAVDIVGDVGADVFQQAVGDSGEEVDVVSFKGLDEKFR